MKALHGQNIMRFEFQIPREWTIDPPPQGAYNMQTVWNETLVTTDYECMNVLRFARLYVKF